MDIDARRKTIIRVCIKAVDGDNMVKYFTHFPTLDILKEFVGEFVGEVGGRRKKYMLIVNSAHLVITFSDYDSWKQVVRVAGVIIGTITYNKIFMYELDESEAEYLVKDGKISTNASVKREMNRS